MKNKINNLIKTLSITRLSHDGRGVSRDENKVIFVHGALPQETVEAKITKRHRQYDEAVCVDILQPSPDRIKPLCEHFGICGGCQLQHIDSSKQIEYKQASLQEQLLQHQITPDAWLPPLTSTSTGYRQKARLGVRFVDKKEALLIGFREQNSNKIALIHRCATLDPRVGESIEDLKIMMQSLTGMRQIPQIEMAIGDDEVALVFRHLEPLSENDYQILIEFCKAKQFTCYLQPGSPESVHQIWPSPTKTTLTYSLKDQNLTFEFHPLDFTQVNAIMNQAMINQALERLAVQKHHVVLDLFCGLGNFSLPLAQRAHHVVGVEGAAGMVQRAKSNAKLNGIENAEFYTADLAGDWSTHPFCQQSHAQTTLNLGKAASERSPRSAHLVHDGGEGAQPTQHKFKVGRVYDSVLLDPPRSGAQAIVEQIQRFQAKTILYISCNPATFVRDAAILVHQKGYRFAECGIMDMFPQTAHVETMGLFIKEG